MRRDWEYEKRIDALIPIAEEEATKKVKAFGRRFEQRIGELDGKLYTYCFWTKYFHRAMNRLAARAGIRFC